jgi:hypothetical protein
MRPAATLAVFMVLVALAVSVYSQQSASPMGLATQLIGEPALIVKVASGDRSSGRRWLSLGRVAGVALSPDRGRDVDSAAPAAEALRIVPPTVWHGRIAPEVGR